MNRVERKRTERGLNSKRKRWLRNRGMTRQDDKDKLNRELWSFEAMAEALRRPLRGIKADIHDTPRRERFQKKPGFLSRIFRRVNA